MSANIDWDNLKFAFQPAKSMFIAKSNDGGEWNKGELLPFGEISMSPAACILHYGQGLIEGMKAQHTKEGKIVIFRPQDYAKRMTLGAKRLCMLEYPPEQFVDAVKKVAKENSDYVPPYGKGSLYIRPCLWGTSPVLGVTPSMNYTFLIMACPVGPYFKGGVEPIKIEVTTDYHRAAPKGTGNVKTISNYACSMLPAKLSKKKGYSECLYLDAKYDNFVEEIGGGNFFCIREGKLLTPRPTTVLSGIIRDSVMKIASNILGIEVIETDIPIADALTADEAFCTGTAAVVSPIGALIYKGKEVTINNFKVGDITRQIYQTLTSIQLKEANDQFGWIVEV